jgi:hypothetical protein
MPSKFERAGDIQLFFLILRHKIIMAYRVLVNVYVILGDSPQINLNTASKKFGSSQGPFTEGFLFEALHFDVRKLCNLVFKACNEWLRA